MTSAANSASSSVPPGGGQRGPAQVVVEVEVGILDPQRVVEMRTGLDEAAAERRQQGQPVLDQLPAHSRRSSRPGAVDGSKIAVDATCMWLVGVSRYRNVASRPVSRCMRQVSQLRPNLPI